MSCTNHVIFNITNTKFAKYLSVFSDRWSWCFESNKLEKCELIYSFVSNYVLTITSIFRRFLVTGQDILYVWIPSIYGFWKFEKLIYVEKIFGLFFYLLLCYVTNKDVVQKK